MKEYQDQKAQALELVRKIRESGLSGKFMLEQWQQQNQMWVAAMSYLTYKEIDNLVQSVAVLRDPQSSRDEQSSVFGCCKEMLEVKGMLVGVDELRKRNVQASREFKLQICELAREKAEDRMQMLGFKFVPSPQPVTAKVRQYRAELKAQQKTYLQSAELANQSQKGYFLPSFAKKIVICIEKPMKRVLKMFFFWKEQCPDEQQNPQAPKETEAQLI